MIVKEAAAGLAGANVSVLNGADGLSQIAAGLVGQGLTILESVKRSLIAPVGPEVALYDDGASSGQPALPDTPNGQPR
jgi:flotillin